MTKKSSTLTHALCLVLLFLLTFSCKQEQASLIEIDPRNFADNKITLSEIAEDLTYTPLDNSFPIGGVFKLKMIDNDIYLSTKDVGITQFDRNGKFIRKFGQKGRGPGEYIYGHSFAVDELTRNVFVPDLGKIKEYTPSGVFLRDISYESYVGGEGIAQDIEVFNSLLFIPDFDIFGNSKYDWVFLDTLGNLVSKKENSVPKFETRLTGGGSIYSFGNNLFYYNYASDTIFSISPDLNYQGAYLLPKGDFRWPQTKIVIHSESHYFTLLNNLFQPYFKGETNRYIMFSYFYNGIDAFCFINKVTKKTFLAYTTEEEKGPRILRKTKSFLVNDLDGGMPLSEDVRYLFVNNQGYLAELINPLDLKAYVSSDEFRRIVPKYPEKKEAFRNMVDKLKETDNPVLMIMKLKK